MNQLCKSQVWAESKYVYHTCEKQKHETIMFFYECIILQIFISSSPETSELSDSESEPLASSSGKASAIPCFREAAAALGGACKYWTHIKFWISKYWTHTYFFELLTYFKL